jgi:hypothetical protein
VRTVEHRVVDLHIAPARKAVHHDAWEVGNVVLGGHDHAGLDGVYLRLTLGGGGFWFR